MMRWTKSACSADLLPWLSESTEIVDPFENENVADGGLREHVAIKTGECVGAEAVSEKVVAADALVENAYVHAGGL